MLNHFKNTIVIAILPFSSLHSFSFTKKLGHRRIHKLQNESIIYVVNNIDSFYLHLLLVLKIAILPILYIKSVTIYLLVRNY